MSQIWCNSQWLPAADHPGAAQDRGAFLGLALFETMLAFNGKLVFPDRHLARLRRSAERLSWSLEFPELHKIAADLLSRNELTRGRARLRLIVTGGSGPHNNLTQGADRLLWLAAFPAPEQMNSVSLCLSPWPRNERSPLAGLKTACYAENLVALDDARRRGFEETIFLNTAGHVCECAMANLFMVKNGRVSTPSLESGCLPGIGREVVWELASALAIEVNERIFTIKELHDADEIFITSSVRGPVAVSRVGTRKFETTVITDRLCNAWRSVTSRLD